MANAADWPWSGALLQLKRAGKLICPKNMEAICRDGLSLKMIMEEEQKLSGLL